MSQNPALPRAIVRAIGSRKLLSITTDPADAPRWMREAQLELGETRYESRHGVGTATGWYPVAPDRRSPCDVGDEVEILAIVGKTSVAATKARHAKLFFAAVRVTKTAAQAEFDAAAQDAAIASHERRWQALAGVLQCGTLSDARDALMQAGADRLVAASGPWSRYLNGSAVVAGAPTASQKSLRAVGEIMSASSRPTMSFRNLPPEFIK